MQRSVIGTLVRRLAPILLVLALLAPLAVPSASATEPRHSPAHPSLQRLADQDPNQLVRVIVQSRNSDSELEAKVEHKGGKGKKALHLIKGVAAEISAGKAQELADDPDVKWVTLDAPMLSTAGPQPIEISGLATDYPASVRATELWTSPARITGAGVTVAVIDSGFKHDLRDFEAISTGRKRVLEEVRLNSEARSNNDKYGHGTAVAGIIAGSGRGYSRGEYIGIAPDANLINVKVSDEQGMAYLSDVVEGLEWVVRNRDLYNIRVVNLSLVSGVPESYLTSPLDAAVEMAWLSGIAVVVSAGNLGADSMLYPPANDPFAITVGAVDTNGTSDISDDQMPAWSSYGQTAEGFSKPEVVAPGRRIVSLLSQRGCILARVFPERVVDNDFIRLSGTSMAAPVVSGIAALALQAHPGWTPDQVKSALVATARPISQPGSGAGEVDAVAVVSLADPDYANRGLPMSIGISALTGTTSYDSATWNSATWNSATWNSATWNSATWNSATWNSATWNSAYPD